MTITNGYCGLKEFKDYARIDSVSELDDEVIERLIEGVSRRFENEIPGGPRTFYSRTHEVRYFDCPHGTNDNLTLWLDEDLLSIDANGLVNGNGDIIDSTDYNLIEKNVTPHYAIRLKRGANIGWEPDSDGNYDAVISITGTWGYSSTTPADVKTAVKEIAKSAYARRTGENMATTSLSTAAGVVITPEDIPRSAWKVIQSYGRILCR